MSDDIAALGISVDSTQAASAAGNLDKLTQSAGTAEQATTNLGNASSTAGQKVSDFQAKLVASMAATKGITEAQAAALLGIKNWSSGLDELPGKIDKVTEANSKMGLNMMQSVGLMQVVRAAVSGNIESMAASGAVLTARFGLLTGSTLLWAGALAALLAPLGATIAAQLQYEDSQQKLLVSTLGLGAASGQTAAQLTTMASVLSQSSTQSNAALLSTASAFDAAGIKGSQSISNLTSIAGEFATVTGEKLPKAQEDLAKAFDGTAKSVFELNDKWNFLSDAELREIQNLSDVGDKQKVVEIASGALKDRIDGVYNATNNANKAWQDQIKWLQDTWTEVGKLADQYQFLGGVIFAVTGGSAAGFKQPKDAGGALGGQGAIQTSASRDEVSRKAFADQQGLPDQQLQSNIRDLQGKASAEQAEMAIAPKGSQAYEDASRAFDIYGQAAQRAEAAVSKFGGTVQGVQNEIGKLQAELKSTPRGAGRSGIEEQIYSLQHLTDLKSDSELGQSAKNAGGVAGARTPKAPTEDRSAKYEDETKKINDNAAAIKNEAAAYQTDAYAAMQAKAAADAKTAADAAADGPKGQQISAADLAARTQANLNQEVQKAIEADAKATSTMQTKADAQSQVNKLVASGQMSESDASRAVEQGAARLALQTLALHLTGAAATEAAAALKKMTDAQNALNKADDDAQLIKFAKTIKPLAIGGVGGANDPTAKETQSQDFGASEAQRNGQAVIQAEQSQYKTRLANREQYIAQVKGLEATGQKTEQQGIQMIAQYDNATQQARLQNTSNFFDALSSLSSLKSTQLKEIGKVAAIASATIDMYSAITKASTILPYPENLPGMIAIGIQDAANIAKIAGLAGGGPVDGDGGPRDDTQLRRLSRGEFVVNAEGTARNRPLLDQINGSGRSVGMASGGPVSNPGASPPASSGGTVIHADFTGANFGGADPDVIMQRFDKAMRNVYGPAILVQSVSKSVQTTNTQAARQKLNKSTR